MYGVCRNWRLTAPWSGAKILVPAKFILSENDVGLQSLGTEKYVKSGGLESNVPNVEVSIIEGHHFLQQEKPERVNSEMLSFLDKFASEEASAWCSYLQSVLRRRWYPTCEWLEASQTENGYAHM